MICLVMAAALFLAMALVYLAIATGGREFAERAAALSVIVVLVAFFVWFVLFSPRPDYLPPYGTRPQDLPHQMKD